MEHLLEICSVSVSNLMEHLLEIKGIMKCIKWWRTKGDNWYSVKVMNFVKAKVRWQVSYILKSNADVDVCICDQYCRYCHSETIQRLLSLSLLEVTQVITAFIKCLSISLTTNISKANFLFQDLVLLNTYICIA